MSTIDKEKALKDILAIRSTIDKMSGAAIFRDVLFSMGSLFVIFGVLIMLSIGVTWYLNNNDIPYASRWIAALWITLFIFAGAAKTLLFRRKSQKYGMSFNEYLKKILNKTFFGIDLPIEWGGTVLVVYFIKSGQPELIIPMVSLMTGMLFGNLGYVFNEKSLRVFGYLFIGVSTLGFWPCSVNYYLYSIIAFGVLYVAWGLTLLTKSKALQDSQIEQEQSNED